MSKVCLTVFSGTSTIKRIRFLPTNCSALLMFRGPRGATTWRPSDDPPKLFNRKSVTSTNSFNKCHIASAFDQRQPHHQLLAPRQGRNERTRSVQWTRGVAPPHSRAMSRLATAAVNSAPSRLQPYLRLMRLDKPIGTWLLYWPCAWSIALAADAGCLPDFYMLALFGVGAVTMRGAGCVVNDMWDRDLDSKVERTRTRPLASGQLNITDAWVFLAGLLAVGDLVLMQLNWNCVMLGASSLGLIACYPLTKRVFNWPQLFLGMVFNWGALLGWSAVHGMCNFAVCFPLYLAGISWTMVYDTIYAHQDKQDDLKIGIKSTALSFGQQSKSYMYAFSASMATGLTVAGLASQQTFPFYVGVGAVLSSLVYQIATLKIDDPKDCGDKFVANSYLGFVVMAGIILSTLLKPKKKNIVETAE